jgi:DUF4097 and DUF4098 domain-containing protein YvlB
MSFAVLFYSSRTERVYPPASPGKLELMDRTQQRLMLHGIVLTAAMLAASLAAAQTQQEKRFSCGPKPTVSIVNEHGPIAVHPSTGNQVVVRYVLHSDKVEVDTNQGGDRITVESHLLQGATSDNAQVDYEVLVPAGSVVFIHSNSGTLSAEHLTGDVSVEGAATPVDLRGMSEGHIRVRTLSGNILLADIRQVHVVANTIGGDITMRNVDGPLVEVSSNNGKIHYDGDFGGMGSYKLNSHSGDIDASIPATASFDVTATSVKGEVDNDFPLQPKSHSITIPEKGHSFVGVAGRAASSVFLHTFSGKIRLKQR